MYLLLLILFTIKVFARINIFKVLKGAFHVLHNSPAPREDYESQTGTTTYPLKFGVTL